jgi:hypothetical protein
MPRLKVHAREIEWMQCLDCGTAWVGGTGPASRVCVGYEGEGCESRRVVRQITASRLFSRRYERAARPGGDGYGLGED